MAAILLVTTAASMVARLHSVHLVDYDVVTSFSTGTPVADLELAAPVPPR